MPARLGAQPFDAVIAGGGAAGNATALRLARAGWRVALVERRPADAALCGIDLIGADGVARLNRLGLIGRAVPAWLSPAPGLLAVWGDGGSRAFARHRGETGWHVHRGGLRRALAQAALAAGVERIDGMAVRGLQSTGRGWLVHAAGRDGHEGHEGRRLLCRVLVDATGHAARVGALLGVRPRWVRWTDRQLAVHWDGATGDDGLLLNLIEAAADGWWQVLEAGARRRISFHADAATIAGQRLRDPRQLMARLREVPSVWQRQLLCDELAVPRVELAASRVAACASGPRWLAVGAAALIADPLVASASDNALLTAELAAAALVKAADAGPGATRALANYDSVIQRTHLWQLQARALLAARETRWPQSAFWLARARLPTDAAYAEPAAAAAFEPQLLAVPAIWRGRGGQRLANALAAVPPASRTAEESDFISSGRLAA